MKHNISEIAMHFGVSGATISRVSMDIMYPLKHQTSDSGAVGKRLKELGRRRLTRILKRDGRARIPRIAEDLNARALSSVSVGII